MNAIQWHVAAFEDGLRPGAIGPTNWSASVVGASSGEARLLISAPVPNLGEAATTLDSMQALHVAEADLTALNAASETAIWDWIPRVGLPGSGL